MTDFKYENPEFVKWWVGIWVGFVTEYGVDGFRLDGPNGVACMQKRAARKSLWAALLQPCCDFY